MEQVHCWMSSKPTVLHVAGMHIANSWNISSVTQWSGSIISRMRHFSSKVFAQWGGGILLVSLIQLSDLLGGWLTCSIHIGSWPDSFQFASKILQRCALDGRAGSVLTQNWTSGLMDHGHQSSQPISYRTRTVISFLAKKAPVFWCLPVEDETFYRYSYTLSNTNFGFCSWPSRSSMAY